MKQKSMFVLVKDIIQHNRHERICVENLRGMNMLVIDRVNKRYMIKCKYLSESGILNMNNVHNACVRYQLRKIVLKSL